MSRSSLRDAEAVASAFCQIAKAIVLPSSARTGPSRSGPSRPWPTQAITRTKDFAPIHPETEEQVVKISRASSSVTAASDPVSAPVSTRPWPSKDQKLQSASSSAVLTSTATQGSPATASQIAETRFSSGAVPIEGTQKDYTAPGAAPPTTNTTDNSKNRIRPEDTKQVQEKLRGAIPILAPSDVSANAAAAPNVDVEVVDKIQGEKSAQRAATPLAPLDSLNDVDEYDAVKESKTIPLKAAKVPSSRLGRLFHYGGLGAGLAFGAAGSLFRGASGSGADGESQNPFMSEQNVARLVDKLSTMRGAALKLGQFLSIQETKLLPPQIEQVLLRVQNSANYMPVWQMNRVMSHELGGADWRERHFKEFDDVPFASASIGQVHSAVLRDDFPDPDIAGKKVAVKVQFPGVRESIDSDLSYLRWLVSASALLPKGLFLENTLRVMGQELKDECDYAREAEMGRRFREVLRDSTEFEVPKVVDQLSTAKVLTTEMMRGRPLSMASRYTQETRDRIAGSILNLALSELFRFRLMQTDPNWSNFLYNERTGRIQLIDFGATREYSKQFMDDWLRMLQAAVRGDHVECIEWSRKVGYLTGQESEAMEKAHVESMIALGEPFRASAPEPYPFESQTITDRVKAQIPLMLRERLTPPPQETYSLNRKLSGAFLLCARLKAHVHCRRLFEAIEKEYRFGPEETVTTSASATVGQTSNINLISSFGSAEQRRHFHAAFVRAENEPHSAKNFRRHGINLAARFPRAKVMVATDLAGTGSTIAGETVESLASVPTAAPSIVETPDEATVDKVSKAIDLERRVVPAEVSAPAVESPQPDAGAVTAPEVSMGPTLIRGITIPLKPPPPGPEECCMSGCAHCAYDIYAEDLEDFHGKVSAVRKQLTELDPPVTEAEWRSDLLGAFPTESSDSGGADATEADKEGMRERAEREVDRVIGDLDPTMKAFLEMERRMKKQERQKLKDAGAASA
ncbi:ABC1-domain-containing protein [Testicularia cyperi]|uniref:ABC1-domain-containing protein n=1 Tax=Testicularia cyperi TaxID=1882483 RepID=A0A317XKT6_9BASI|nr:ABC1-domain-containing protein [Testicularia cyperi]